MRIEKVVAGIDFSEWSTAAAKWVATAFAPDADLILTHVVDVPHYPAFLRPSKSTESIERASSREALVRLGDLAMFLSVRPTKSIVRTGRAHEELAKMAAEVGADLVVVGAHGDQPRPWKMLGTTAERLVRCAVPAVLVASGGMSAIPNRILVAVDDGPSTREVLKWASYLGGEFNANVTVVHVLSNAAVSHALSIIAATASDEIQRTESVNAELTAEATRWLESLGAAGRSGNRAAAIVAHGKPGDAILETAAEIGADLIVIGRRGTSTVIPAVLGSTVNTVLHGADAPVLVVADGPSDPPNGEDGG